MGTLSRNTLWGEGGAARTPHATTTAIWNSSPGVRSASVPRGDDGDSPGSFGADSENEGEGANGGVGKASGGSGGGGLLLVDPGLPGEVLDARMFERMGKRLSDVTDVFLTSFRPAHRGALGGAMGGGMAGGDSGGGRLDHARWWIGEREREMVGGELLKRYEMEDDSDVKDILAGEIDLLKRCKVAEDNVFGEVDLFPLYGFTPGLCGLVLPLTTQTVVVAGDAVATIDHLHAGRILEGAWDVDAATESLKEVIEIADWVIPGHDNLTNNPVRRPF